MKNLCLVLFCIFIFSTAFAQEASFDFKGITLGSAIDAIESDSRFGCSVAKTEIGDRICSLKYKVTETIAEAPIKNILLGYYYGKLETISIYIPEEHYSSVSSALNEKYGSTPLKTEMLKNRLGASFENRIYSWRRNNAILQATRYSSDLETSSVVYRTDFAMEEFARRKKEADKKKSGDL
jgi:hypothetical protein